MFPLRRPTLIFALHLQFVLPFKKIVYNASASLFVFVVFFCPLRNFWRHNYSNRTFPLSVQPSVPLRVQCISSIFFKVGIPNCVVWMHLGMAACRVPFCVTVTLTSDLVSGSHTGSDTYLLYSLS